MNKTKVYLCFQNKSYEDEKRLGVLWAPMNDARGKTKHFWSNMSKLKEGDIILSYVNRSYVAVNVVTKPWEKAVCPFKTSEWKGNGYLVKLKYKELINPIKMDLELFEEIKTYLPEKYSPFSANGKGNQGYLYELPSKAAKIILKDYRIK